MDFTFLLGLWCWWMTFAYHSSWVLGGLFAILWGLMETVITLGVSHDACHFAITHHPWVWKTVFATTECFHAFSLYSWYYQHHFGHHIYTNIDGVDPDVGTRTGIWRIKKGQKLKSFHKFQHLYMPFIMYAFLGVKMRLQDFHTMWQLKKDQIRLNPLNTTEWCTFFGTKIVHVSFRFLIPYLIGVPFSTVIFWNVVSDAIYGMSLATLTQINHVNSEVMWPEPKDDKMKLFSMDWAEMQCASTQDYATDSWFWTVFTGGLNHQTSHHLFPHMLQSYYPQITPIVRKTCKEFGVRYNYFPTFWETLCCHFRHLQEMGRDGSTLKLSAWTT